MQEQDTHTMEQHLSDRLRDYERANAELRRQLQTAQDAVAELNQRLHERTQAFLGKEARVRGNQATHLQLEPSGHAL